MYSRSIALIAVAAIVLSSGDAVSAGPVRLTRRSSDVSFDPIDMLCRVNELRAKYRLPALALNDDLQYSAHEHSQDQADHGSMSHRGSDGSKPSDRVSKSWVACGENVAYGASDTASCLDAWIASPGHLANLLSESFTHLGVAVAVGGDGTPYWTQSFGGDGREHDFPLCPSSSSDDTYDDELLDEYYTTADEEYGDVTDEFDDGSYENE